MPPAPDTFASLLTPPGCGAIAVVLLAGPAAGDIVAKVFRPMSKATTGRRNVQIGRLADGDDVIDEAVLAAIGGGKAPNGDSAQGEDFFEINLHGGSVVVRRALELLSRAGAAIVAGGAGGACQGGHALPVAHPRWNNPAIGEEMLNSLPLARSALAVAALSRQWSAGLSELACGLLAPPPRAPVAGRRASGKRAAKGGKHAGSPTAERLRHAAAALERMNRLLRPAEVVIAGPPNVGKSQLANVLVGRQVSLVHPEAGTTRDWVREIAVLDGLPVWVTDTAGLWQGGGAVDAEAVRRARRCIAGADLVLLLAEGGAPQRPDWLVGRVVTVLSKADLRRPADPATARLSSTLRPGSIELAEIGPEGNSPKSGRPAGGADAVVSALTGQGLAELKAVIIERIGLGGFDPHQPAAFTDRQAQLLLEAASALDGRDGAAAEAAVGRLLGRTRPANTC